MAVSFILPIIALTFRIVFVNVAYPACVLHFYPMTFVLIALAYQWRSYGIYRPHDAKVFSWEIVVFVFARWPWMLLGSAMALRDWMTGGFVDFRVTPKGAGDVGPPLFLTIAPYAALSLASALPAFLVSDADYASGFYVFALANAVTYAAVFAVIVVQHARENAIGQAVALRPIIATFMLLLFGAADTCCARERSQRCRFDRMGRKILQAHERDVQRLRRRPCDQSRREVSPEMDNLTRGA